MEEQQSKTERKGYTKPAIIMETNLEIVAGTIIVPRPGADGLLDPNQTFFP